MSHILYFYVDEADRPAKKGLFGPLKAGPGYEYVSADDLKSFLHRSGHFEEKAAAKDGFEADYYNKHTGTTMTFRLRRSTIHDVESRYSFPGFSYTGLSVSIEYFRPAYFIHEGSALIEEMCREFRMYVLDPQLSPLLKKCMAVTIVRSWEAGNDKAVRTALAGGAGGMPENAQVSPGRQARPYMPRDRMMAWWKYTYSKEELKKKVGESATVRVHVPEWKIIRPAGVRHQLFFAMTLAEGIGYIMPPCDVYLVKRNGFKEVGAVDARELMPRIREYLRPWSFSGMEFNVLTSSDARKIVGILRDVPLESIHKYEQIAPGSFIDVDAAAGP
ncbi:hypothetical protein [Methanocella arvoryzae]|uniref:Uncharacterized protein n=1 Tax=Methanocella arvoryzae (strain DSM 22066 / NBRC 105507 / MRE50) TaxID=351160 RepID=Q0W6A3_METAR|nr:hypothetical protein [Methanocella arvoryzae]CAJ36090.1 hypothetical protein RCIX700 [Methanocella arvoryzae MRE50]